ncbi:hypothetical protein DAPPUDRAFT_236488 [Daphnia pulex]|uniref:Uncharacterized protein n=1 Tax=Daphnia pulex TaxID=6669 RepID=E9G147_DAPPU|nr:hypothetical protein DAPPUDRAFT_236488 [Daphnia pulex]|eukprot:EFX86700.1 hypothetical protein DAPPUDRAFT_236488 [Daphnia pulex]
MWRCCMLTVTLVEEEEISECRASPLVHYTNCSDHGTPEHPLPIFSILKFVRQSAAANPIEDGPIIVHCSAGVGRTGTYIVLDAMLKQIECKNEINIRGFFVTSAINATFSSEPKSNSDLPASLLSEKIIGSNLTACTLDTTTTTMTMIGSQEDLWLLLDHQFHLVTNFLDPLEATVSDFWQIVWDDNSQTVVVVSDTTDDDYQLLATIRHIHPDEYVTQIEVAAQSLQDDYELRVRIFCCPSWPYRSDANPDLAALFQAATLCALTTLVQLSRDQHVDVYMYAKLYHSKRPNVWPSRDDYMFLYRCVEALHHHLPVPPSNPPTLPTSFSLPLQLNGCAGGGIGDSVSLTSPPPLCTTPSTTSPNGDVVCFRIPPDVYEWDEIKGKTID